jgi:hypothetical protein
MSNERFVGKTVLLGLTFTTADGELVEQLQRHGIIEEVDAESGIAVRLVAPGHPWDGELYRLPPDVSNLVDAAPGAYTLRSTGETVVDPDFTASWEIRSPPPQDDTPTLRAAREEEARRFGFPVG